MVYTFASNLLKTEDMEDGAVSFKSEESRIYEKNVTKDRELLNTLKKTKIEAFPDLRAEKLDHMNSLVIEDKSDRITARLEREEEEMKMKDA